MRILFLVLFTAACSGSLPNHLDGKIRIKAEDSRAYSVMTRIASSKYLDGLSSYGLHPKIEIVSEDEDLTIKIIPNELRVTAWHIYPFIYVSSVIAGNEDYLSEALSHELVETIYDPLGDGYEIADPCDYLTNFFTLDSLVLSSYEDNSGLCWPLNIRAAKSHP